MAATKPPVTVTIPQIHYSRSTARHLAICSHLFITLPLREPASLNATPAPPEYCAKSAALPVAAMATVPRARFVGKTRGMMTVVVNADTAEMLGAAQLRCDGPDDVVVMGPSAARLHGVIPRALATATIAVPRQHREIALSDRPAVVRFVTRDTARLDAERINTPLGPTLVTTPEQTVLDLAHRPRLGDVAIDVRSAVAALYARSDLQRIATLASDQRRVASLRRAEDWAQT